MGVRVVPPAELQEGLPKKEWESKAAAWLRGLNGEDCDRYSVEKVHEVQASPEVILEAWHARNIYFRKLREKLVLTAEDVKAWRAFAATCRRKSKAWWLKNVHAFIDCKRFQVYLNASERPRAAQHATYGAYKSPGGVCEAKSGQFEA